MNRALAAGPARDAEENRQSKTKPCSSHSSTARIRSRSCRFRRSRGASTHSSGELASYATCPSSCRRRTARLAIRRSRTAPRRATPLRTEDRSPAATRPARQPRQRHDPSAAPASSVRRPTSRISVMWACSRRPCDAAGRARASSTVKLLDGLPFRPAGGFTSEATFRFTRSSAWACRIARSRQFPVICGDRRENCGVSSVSAHRTSPALRLRSGCGPMCSLSETMSPA